ncbi:MAG: bifunctional aspartate kinase/homoserine dehydrogenase I [Ignavibacteriae bacterium]|nr:bifunctional aspartate kinase/homoserine dehydrogenase I [Ignavibacteria bacterium]MBI3363364.1 bifunctional aspartate kinase/homoserine dehydrogenase I [Ignavibacteriota bacterium]
MKVMKFGGSSVSTPERIKDVAEIVLRSAKKERTLVVVSAFQGVTDLLLECSQQASSGDAAYETLYTKLAKRHRDVIKTLLGKRTPMATLNRLEEHLEELRNVFRGVYLLRDCPPRALDIVGSFGERLSAIIIASYLQRKHSAQYVDARQLIVTDDQFTHASVLFDRTNAKTKSYFKKLFAGGNSRTLPVITGFIASTEDGRTTTIGRNGSDYTAAIIGAAVGADLIEIWTDVDGMYSADPRIVPSAFVLPQLSYEEAMELSYFGAKVLHSATIAPAVAKTIPILIKNTMNPSAPGTLISQRAGTHDEIAKGITSVDDITLLTLRGMSMVGVPGTAERLFRALASNNVSVIVISQASSEHTICFAVRSADVPRARKAIHYEFRYELQHSLTALDEKHSQTIVAIVGEGMKGKPGVAGSVFQSLGRNNININAIAQGASELNISFVTDSGSSTRALNVIHQAFFEKRKHLALFVIGIGNIGSALLGQLQRQQSFLHTQGFDVRVCGIANSKQFIINQEGLNLAHWQEELSKSTRAFQPLSLAEHVATMKLTNIALVDCTASADVVAVYPEFVKANMHIITPNKKANVLPWRGYNRLMELLRQRQKHFLYEANVGAGLPIISTLQDLIASGDTIVKIDGILSGTLSYLFNTFDGRKPFSELIRDAHARGFAEPDPRDDLSGMDVARKLLILARQLGSKMELRDIRVESLVPKELRTGKFSEKFYARLARFDSVMQHRVEKARSRNMVLRYVGTFCDGAARAGLQEVPVTHPLASTKGSDNIIVFTTHRYSNTPLVVQGPGAGADVTAMGVFSDILKLLHYLPS